jgi:hypothetical protein
MILNHIDELSDQEIGQQVRYLRKQGYTSIRIDGPLTEVSKKKGGVMNINLNTLANCVTAVCAVLLTIKVW